MYLMFSEILKEQLRDLCMSQKHLAEEAGVSECQVSHYISGDRLPNIRNFYKICDATGMDPGEILEIMYGGDK